MNSDQINALFREAIDAMPGSTSSARFGACMDRLERIEAALQQGSDGLFQDGISRSDRADLLDSTDDTRESIRNIP